MKFFKRIFLVLGTLFIIVFLFFGFKFGGTLYKKYQFEKGLSNTAFDTSFSEADYEEAKTLDNGNILSKKQFEISEIPPIWERVSKDDKLLKEFDYLKEVNFYQIVYKSDSLLINGFIAEPKKKGKFPVIIVNRGGNKEEGVSSQSKGFYPLLQFSNLVKEGYVLVASCYRENDEFGGKDINDVLYLTQTVKKIEKADANRIGMIGWSRGGMMTYLALKHSEDIKTAIVGNGPSDLFPLIEERPEMESRVCAKLIPNYEENKTSELKKRSVYYWPEELDKNASLLILCGTRDEQVNPNQAKKIAQKLSNIDYDFQLKEFDPDHSFSDKKQELQKLMTKWFDDRL